VAIRHRQDYNYKNYLCCSSFSQFIADLRIYSQVGTEASFGGLFHSAQATVTKCHKQRGLKNRNALPHSCGDWESKIKVSAGLVPPEGCEGDPLQASGSFSFPSLLKVYRRHPSFVLTVISLCTSV
jgi:hypothetical protein